VMESRDLVLVSRSVFLFAVSNVLGLGPETLHALFDYEFLLEASASKYGFEKGWKDCSKFKAVSG